jgi:PleD family two-component response regulator
LLHRLLAYTLILASSGGLSKGAGVTADDEALNEFEVEDESEHVSSPGYIAEPADVLVVDDHELGRRAVVRLLRDAGLSVIASGSAIGATRLAIQSRVRLVIADLNMPAMRGSALLTVFRRNPRLANVPVVLLSGVSADELVAAASEVGADAALSKVEMGSTLLPTVQRLLRRGSRPRQVSGEVSLLPSDIPPSR